MKKLQSIHRDTFEKFRSMHLSFQKIEKNLLNHGHEEKNHGDLQFSAIQTEQSEGWNVTQLP